MSLVLASKDILNQLKGVIEQLKEQDFSKSIPVLNNSTIGQHCRHTLEFYTCLKNSLDSGVINYDKRDHDKVIETDKLLSIALIDELKTFLESCKDNVSLKLESCYSIEGNEVDVVDSNLNRELAYNIEHAIHHMAIIKIGLKSIAPYVEIPEHFGVAVSTVKYQRKSLSADS